MILSGNPIHVNMFLIRRSAILFVSAVFIVGDSIIPFVSPWFTTDKIESKPYDLGKSVIRSMEIWAKGHRLFGPGIGCKGGLKGRHLILFCWQRGQPFT